MVIVRELAWKTHDLHSLHHHKAKNNAPKERKNGHEGEEEEHINTDNVVVVKEIVKMERRIFPKHESLALSFYQELSKRNCGLLYALCPGGESRQQGDGTSSSADNDNLVAGYVMYSWSSCLVGSINKLAGGHTAEMLNLVAVLNKERFYPRWYIAAATDNMSLARAQTAEESGMEQAGCKAFQGAKYMQIYRSREVGQSYLTSIGTTLKAIVHAAWLIFKIRPDVILCNGPGTCIPLCVAGFGLKVFGIKWVTIFYVESIARVRKLSLSGLLLYKLHFADQLFVQWPELKKKYPKAQYVGRLM